MLLARLAGIPAHVVAPTTTLDPHLATGRGIVIEERGVDEVRCVNGRAVCPPGTAIRNPAFDITPGRSITSLITERGTVVPPLDCLFHTAGNTPARERNKTRQ